VVRGYVSVLLIDAYNLLHQPMPPALAGLDKVRLCQLLARTTWVHEGVRVICDGQPGPLDVQESPVPLVELLFSGARQKADDVIMRMVEKSTSPRQITVVSDDREIRQAARRRRCTCWGTGQFIHELLRQLRQAGASMDDKPSPDKLQKDDVEHWLRTFGYDPPASHDTEDQREDDPWPPE